MHRNGAMQGAGWSSVACQLSMFSAMPSFGFSGRCDGPTKHIHGLDWMFSMPTGLCRHTLAYRIVLQYMANSPPLAVRLERFTHSSAVKCLLHLPDASVPVSPGSRILKAPLPHAQLLFSGCGLLVQQLGQTLAFEMPAHAVSFTRDRPTSCLHQHACRCGQQASSATQSRCMAPWSISFYRSFGRGHSVTPHLLACVRTVATLVGADGKACLYTTAWPEDTIAAEMSVRLPHKMGCAQQAPRKRRYLSVPDRLHRTFLSLTRRFSSCADASPATYGSCLITRS